MRNIPSSSRRLTSKRMKKMEKYSKLEQERILMLISHPVRCLKCLVIEGKTSSSHFKFMIQMAFLYTMIELRSKLSYQKKLARN